MSVSIQRCTFWLNESQKLKYAMLLNNHLHENIKSICNWKLKAQMVQELGK